MLAERLGPRLTGTDPLVLAVPRGGVPVAAVIAKALRAEMDIFLVRKLGTPGQEELALGAIASGGHRVLNRELIDYLHVSNEVIEAITAAEKRELARREELYRRGRKAIPIAGRTVVLVDDGLATGASMLVAVRAVRAGGAAKVIVAVPVAARATCDEFRREVDEIYCGATPEPFGAVGTWYEDFSQVTDEEVHRLLDVAADVHASKVGAG